MNAYLETARRAARGAGELIRQKLGQAVDIRHKGRIDLVTEVDLACERLLTEQILRDWPEHSILGEEQGLQRRAGEAPLWIVDPLDGTRSFAHGYPFVCVSVALEIQGQVRVGVVYDPIRDELFEATQGGGARLNGQPIHVSPTDEMEQALLVTGFPYQLREIDYQTLFDLFRDMVVNSGGIRRDGSAALDFCYVACGRMDGFWEFFLNPWDAAAGALVVVEAGGTVSNMLGEPFDLRKAEVLASNGLIHRQLQQCARPYVERIRKYL